MSRWRILLVAVLMGVPFLALAGVGSYYLWSAGLGWIAWVPMTALMALGYCLAWYWQSRRELLRPPDFEVEPYWTDRDKQAWKLVEARAARAAELPQQKMGDVQFYLETAQEMGLEIAAYYHPGSRNPVGGVTVPEVLAIIELASHDMAELVDRHLPGGHLLTIDDWRRAQDLTKWYNTANNVYWIISALFNPVQTGMRYAASQVGVSQPFRMLQQNLFAWFYTAFIHRLGTYLVDLNSGRLRVGATRYRELVERMKRAAAEDIAPLEKVTAGPFRGEADPIDQVGQVTITIIGQVKAGKSSLVNALLGEQRARTDVLPATDGIDRYELHTPGIPTKLMLQDTVGYGHEGPRADQLKATAEAARGSDLLFLVLHARNPARAADVAMLDGLRQWFADRPDLKCPPVLAVVTHIDLLSPSLEWAPPYDWVRPERPKETNIRDALLAVRQQLGEYVVTAVPVCATPGKVFGVEEAVLPAIAQWLDEVRGVALLRVLKAEADRGKVKKVFHQLAATGKEVARLAWEALSRPAGS